jgi:TctA family transporter
MKSTPPDIPNGMHFLHLIRLVTAVIAVAYCCDSLQDGWVYWLMAHFANASTSFGRGYSSSISPAQTGVYVTSLAAVPVVFFAIPRFRWGVPALSWCLLIMGAFLLSNLHRCLWDGQNLSFVMEIICFGRQLSFALAPLIIGMIVRYRFVEEELRSATPPTSTGDYRSAARESI